MLTVICFFFFLGGVGVPPVANSPTLGTRTGVIVGATMRRSWT